MTGLVKTRVYTHGPTNVVGWWLWYADADEADKAELRLWQALVARSIIRQQDGVVRAYD
jgi:hypothetical protein